MYPGMQRTETVEGLLASLHSSYRNEDKRKIAQDVRNLCFSYDTLKVAKGVLTRNDGSQHELLKIFGTVKILFKNSSYYIPIDLWVSEGYPHATPQIYVTPTKDMLIQPDHKHVNTEGLVYLPYLNQWNSQRSNLVELVSECAQVFSQNPPVYAKPKPIPVQATSRSPPPVYNPYGSSTSNGGGPPPAYPMSSTSQRMQPRETEEQRHKNLVRALEMKLHREFKLFNSEISKETQIGIELQEKLEKGRDIIKETKSQLENQQEELLKLTSTFDERKVQLIKWLQENENKSPQDEVSVDDIVQPEDVWSRQLFEAVAKSAAAEDTMYHLDRALAREVIDLKTFLKETRKMARRQFMAKALALKIMSQQQKQKYCS